MWGQPGGYGGGMQGGYGGGMQGGYGGGMQGGYGGGMQGGYGMGGGMQGGYGMGGMGVNIMPGNKYKILSAFDRKYCLDSSQGLFDYGHLILYSYHGGDNQAFTFVPDQFIPGAYIILNYKNEAVEPPHNWNQPGQVWLDREAYT